MLLADKNICIAVKERLVKDSGVASDDGYNGIVLKLASKPNAKGCAPLYDTIKQSFFLKNNRKRPKEVVLVKF